MTRLSDVLTLRGPRYAFRRWLYRGGSPNRLARALLRVDVGAGRRGVGLARQVVLEVRGRTSGKTISVPLVVAAIGTERYVVSMLGTDAGWVRNVRAAGGHAVMVHGERTPVLLEDVPVADRAPILRRYLDLAPGARAHVIVDRRAPLADFAEVAGRYPVFRVVDVPA
ncbi:MAG: nitroreductase/quinone reductase family protein [Promicromonosporaceae bacterium]|nr:nitroreductase/quinone reductase family protein [Promicromonosporaceae bacterium]